MSLVRVLLLLAVCSLTAFAQAWQAGVAKTVITPRESIWMAGYGARTKPSEGVRQDIYAKALALRDGAGHTVVLVTLDLVGISREQAAEIAAQCRAKFNLERRQILFNASHSHSGPLAMERESYDLPADQLPVIERYGREFVGNVVRTVGVALETMAPAELAFEQGFAGFAVNRRRVGNRQYPGPVDPDVPVLAVRGADGSLRAVVAGYACHATVLSDYQINGDWPGYGQQEIERAHPGAVALFVAGCGADSNPLPRRTVRLAETYGRVFASAVGEVLQGKMRPVRGNLIAAFQIVDVPFRTPPTRQELEERLKDKNSTARKHAERLLRILARDGKLPTTYPYPIHVIRFGGAFKMIAMGGEVVVDYSLRLKALHGWNDTWVAGYSNDVMGYIPSERVLREGGYEGGGAMLYQNHPGPFGEGIEDTIVKAAGALVDTAR